MPLSRVDVRCIDKILDILYQFNREIYMKKYKGITKISEYIFVMLIIVISLMLISCSDERGFIMAGNRLSISTKSENDNLFIEINKRRIKSDAHQGIVKIAVSPKIPEGMDLPQGFEYPIMMYEFVFTNNKNELFIMQVPYSKNDYIVFFQVGIEETYRVIWHRQIL
jgi:hypothetical protein